MSNANIGRSINTNNEKHAGGRPKKLSIEEKTNFLNLFFVHYGSAEALAALSGHGKFTSLAQFAVDMGYMTVRDYDFANDREFRAKLEEFLTIERQRFEREIVIPELPYEGLDIARLLSASPSDMEKQLAEHEQYCKSLYSFAAVLREERDHLSAMVKAKESELAKLRSDTSTQTAEIQQLQKELKDQAALERELRRQLAEQRKLLSKNTRERALAAAEETACPISGQTLLGAVPEASPVLNGLAKGKITDIRKRLSDNSSSSNEKI